jgi:hypothetical protein
VGADIVEFNPWQDASGRTAMVAAKLLKEIAALMIQAKNPGGEGPVGRKPGGVDVQRQLG